MNPNIVRCPKCLGPTLVNGGCEANCANPAAAKAYESEKKRAILEKKTAAIRKAEAEVLAPVATKVGDLTNAYGETFTVDLVCPDCGYERKGPAFRPVDTPAFRVCTTCLDAEATEQADAASIKAEQLRQAKSTPMAEIRRRESQPEDELI